MPLKDAPGRRALSLVILLLTALLAGCSGESGAGAAAGSEAAPSGPRTIAVSGNRLVDAAGDPVPLRGVSRAGSEYACIDGWGVFAGPVDQPSIDAMLSWGINTVRIPLNSACWLDLRDQFATYNAAYAGAAYQEQVSQYVDLLTAAGMFVVLDLQWTGCGQSPCLANSLKPMPDRPYATQLWTEVAGRFKDYRNVLFDVYNEPHDVDWECWGQGGCTVGGGEQAFEAEGMAALVAAVRSAGAASQPILVGGLQYANDMTGWLDHLPTDPADSLVASIHLYDFNWPCPGQAGTAAAAIECFSEGGANSLEEVARDHPVVFGELGQDGCATDFVNPMLGWIQEHGFGVLGWAWTVADCSSFPSLISDYDGTPTALGAAFKTHFAAAAGIPSASAAPRAKTAAPTEGPSPGGVSDVPTSDQVISRGRPAFASVGTAGNANDADYATAWQVPPGAEEWLAYDLSDVPADRRWEVVLAWYTVLDDGYTTEQIGNSCPAWHARPFLGTYAVEVSSAPGGGQPPDSGWREVASVSVNLRLSGQHLVELDGATWIRVRGSGPNGVEVNVDVASADSGDSGGWLFMGDSLTTGWAGHNPIADASGTKVPGVPQLLSARTDGALEPLGQNNGVACAYTSGALGWIDSMLDDFHGHYVALSFGTNDGWGGQGDPEQFRSRMLQLVEKVEDRGSVAVVPTIPWPNNGGEWDSKVRAMNDQIRQLYREHPSVIPGPDLYALLEGKPELFGSAGDVHPNEVGVTVLREAWAETLLTNVYHR